MCGIAGIIQSGLTAGIENKNSVLQTVRKMTDALAHRGPDGEGSWMNYDGTVCFGHRRLAVIDLSPSASQPMHYSASDSDSLRYSITYNGEIYNYIEIRETLLKKGYFFKTLSDTEVILAAYDYWKEECLQQFDGMFAFAIWDEHDQTLFAARDRFGEKPFYFFQDDNRFVFSSEMKAMWAIGIDKTTDDKMLLNYIALGYLQNPNDKEQTFFENIYSLPPAHYLYLEPGKTTYHTKRYWDIDKEINQIISPDDAIKQFNKLFNTSVSRRLRSDVSLGTSLSGGLDSSSIAAMIDESLKSTRGIKTFSARFPGFEKDESVPINSVVQKFNFENFSVTPTADGLLKDFEKLCYYQEEPFPSSSIYAQYKVFELAKTKDVKVLLDGQGADETLAGYHKYIHWYLQQLVNRYRFSAAINEKKKFRFNEVNFSWGIQDYFAAYLPAHAAIRLENNEYKKIARNEWLDKNFIRSFRGSEWEGIHKPIVTKLNDILYFNTSAMGLEELLRFADRNSMAHGREVRLPFLNHELVAFIFSLPAYFKIHDGFTKWLLRKAMEKKLPDEIVWRKDKVGFEPPQQMWMHNHRLQEFMQESKRKLVKKGILKKQVLDKKIIPLAANEANNYDWRYLCAAQIL